MSLDFTFVNSNEIEGLVQVRFNNFEDHRGSLWSSYVQKDFSGIFGSELLLNHDKFALNKKNVLRGIHGDFTSWKYVTVLAGEIFQVFVDNRKNSSTYLQYETTNLLPTDYVGYLIPPGVGNGFLALEDNTLYNYKLAYIGEYKDHDEQFTLKWNDSKIGIEWPISNPILSERDAL